MEIAPDRNLSIGPDTPGLFKALNPSDLSIGNISRLVRGMEPGATRKVTLPRVLSVEVGFECRWFLHAWNDLVKQVATEDSQFIRNPTEGWLNRWELIDRLLTHVTRIDRLLNPAPGRAPDTYEQRARAAGELRDVLPKGIFSNPNIRAVRNISEHADEYLPQFLQANEGRRTASFAMGATEVPNESGQIPKNIAFRSYDPLSGHLEVFGVGLDLRAVVEEVRRLTMALPAEASTLEVELGLPAGFLTRPNTET